MLERPAARQSNLDYLIRKGHVPASPMTVIAIVDVREALKARRQSLSHSGLAHKALSRRVGPARHIQGAIVGKELHDRIQVVSIEGVEDGLERFCRNGLLLRHPFLLPVGLTRGISRGAQRRRLDAVVGQPARSIQTSPSPCSRNAEPCAGSRQLLDELLEVRMHDIDALAVRLMRPVHVPDDIAGKAYLL